MTDVICLQCWAMLREIRAAHRDHQLYHPPSKHPVHLPANDKGPTGYNYGGPVTFDSDSTNQPVITYPDSDIQ